MDFQLPVAISMSFSSIDSSLHIRNKESPCVRFELFVRSVKYHVS